MSEDQNSALEGLRKHIRGLLWKELTCYFWSIYSVSSNHCHTLLKQVLGEKKKTKTTRIQSNKKKHLIRKKNSQLVILLLTCLLRLLYQFSDGNKRRQTWRQMFSF